jgi:hypothetical protein
MLQRIGANGIGDSGSDNAVSDTCADAVSDTCADRGINDTDLNNDVEGS